MKLTFHAETQIGDKRKKFDIQPSGICGAKTPVVPINIEQNIIQGVWYEKPEDCCKNFIDAGFVLSTILNVTQLDIDGKKILKCKLAQDPSWSNMLSAKVGCPIKTWVKENLPPPKEEDQDSVLGE